VLPHAGAAGQGELGVLVRGGLVERGRVQGPHQARGRRERALRPRRSLHDVEVVYDRRMLLFAWKLGRVDLCRAERGRALELVVGPGMPSWLR